VVSTSALTTFGSLAPETAEALAGAAAAKAAMQGDINNITIVVNPIVFNLFELVILISFLNLVLHIPCFDFGFLTLDFL
jgi:hypothetical protein